MARSIRAALDHHRADRHLAFGGGASSFGERLGHQCDL
jgi:hypothetical protein